MPKKYTITYCEAQSSITMPVTKFGGRPVWLEEPCWPVSRMYGTPMHFICQIALDSALFGEPPTRMAYLFLTDWDYESPYPDNFDPERGENALILQPGGSRSGPCLPLYEGPSLYRRFHRNGRWEHVPCEFAVELHLGDDPDIGAWDPFSDDKAAEDAYWAALLEDKVGGTPVPTPFGPGFEGDFEGWRLVLQLNAKDNADGTGPFSLNMAYDAVGYAFVSPDGRSGMFLWTR